jgi:hypothetical protein
MDLIIATLDTAYTTKTENDPSAMTIWGVFTSDVTASAPTMAADRYGNFVDFARQHHETNPGYAHVRLAGSV